MSQKRYVLYSTVYNTFGERFHTHTGTPHPDTFTSTNDPCWSVQFPIRMPKRKTCDSLFSFESYARLRLPWQIATWNTSTYIIHTTHTHTLERLLAEYFDPFGARYFRIFWCLNTSYFMRRRRMISFSGDVLCSLSHELGDGFNFLSENQISVHFIAWIRLKKLRRWMKTKYIDRMDNFQTHPSKWLYTGTGCSFGMFYVDSWSRKNYIEYEALRARGNNLAQ